jgi:hypothetical protein
VIDGKLQTLKMKYGGKLRYILYKNLAEELFFNPKEYLTIAATNINAHFDNGGLGGI